MMLRRNPRHPTHVQSPILQGTISLSLFILLSRLLLSYYSTPSYEEPNDDFVSWGHSPHSHHESEWGGITYNKNDSLHLRMGDPFQEDLGIFHYVSYCRT